MTKTGGGPSYRDMFNSPRVRRGIALGLAIACFLCLAWYEVTKQARLQQPRVFVDSAVYLETAAQPIAFDQVFYPKPFTVPAVYHFLDADPAAIAAFQLWFALVAWTLFGLSLCVALRRTRARVAAIAITFVFLLAPYRIGFASAILSESITDSLAALALAIAFVLTRAAGLPLGRTRSIACWSATVALVLVTIAWLLARDSNAIAAFAALAIAGVVWRLHRTWREAHWAVVLAGAVAVASAFSVWTSRTAPAAPTHLQAHQNYPAEYFPRAAFPTLNNVMLRALRDPEGRKLFIEHGLPQVDELDKLDWDVTWGGFFEDPRYAPARTWIAEHASSVYMRWLAAHPLDRADELARHTWDILAPDTLTWYMPPGWISSYGFPGWTVRRATTSELLLLGLVLAAPFVLRRPRGHVTSSVAIVLIGSGVLAAAAGYYGDAIELTRHTFGAGQQIVLGLFLAPLAWLDRPRDGQSTRGRLPA